MKQLFILFLFLAIYSINCTLLECELETDLTKCFDHKVEDVENFSCHRCNYDLSALRGIIDEDDEETLYPDNCRSYPDTKEKQDIFWKLTKGNAKEEGSFLFPFEKYDEYYALNPKKEFFDKNETLEVAFQKLSKEDMRIIRSKNTCTYKLLGKVYEAKKLVNIEDNSECFGTYQFPEHVDLVNCGHASISFNISGSNQTFKSCFYIPDNHFAAKNISK